MQNVKFATTLNLKVKALFILLQNKSYEVVTNTQSSLSKMVWTELIWDG